MYIVTPVMNAAIIAPTNGINDNTNTCEIVTVQANETVKQGFNRPFKGTYFEVICSCPIENNKIIKWYKAA